MTHQDVSGGGRGEVGRVADLLGGPAVLRHTLSRSIDAHDLLLDGLPVRAFTALLANLRVLNIQKTASLDRAVGMSLRTFQRHKEQARKTLSQEQSGKAWKFAEVLSRATSVFGSQEEAETWLDKPAVGLDGRRPIDLLATPAGVELVEELLTRLEYGVYV
ncbi:type II RES/Xre toxin-antitoxin system antitoxin [Terrihabitans sp. B22-R8]|uniref:type II RES/Xre toxin-antitoxin system antitoxin n=1 Tax=Terrihabitans sp. B22-R8 TaxID=3425128 RepID=UPI00403C4F0F